MADDRFDRDMAARLRAYESRLPDAPAPALASGGRRRNNLPLILAGGVTALAAVVLALVVLQSWGRDQIGDPVATLGQTASAPVEGTPEPSASATPPATPASTPSPATSHPPSARPTNAPPPATAADLAWSETGSFASDGDGPSMVQHLVAVDGGYVAAGVAYAAQLPGIGPTPPHTLRTFLSADGRTWRQADPQLENVEFTALVVRADGVLLATGRRGTVNEFGVIERTEQVAWTSTDGRSWAEASIGMPTVPTTIVRGAQGYLALLRPDLATEEFELWHSLDALTWTAVRDGVSGRIDVAAGEEGFVVTGTTSTASDQTFAVASGDGREWFEASSPPPASSAIVAPFGADWIVMNAFGSEGGTATGRTWRSDNGLDWVSHGQAPIARVETDGTTCVEYPRHVRSAGAWLVTATDLGFPCGEGSFVVHGTQLLSSDGATWTPLPFTTGTPGVTRSGAIVNAAAPTQGGLIVAGELDGVATFWIGEGS